MNEAQKITAYNHPGLFVTFLLIAVASGLVIELSGLFKRQELQTINQRFEARNWLKWEPKSLERLNPATLWEYHEKHEIPRRWWAWDYTLSWLIENNHPAIKQKFVLFNHQFEDEPPPEAVTMNPWMKPLLKWPLSRASIADSLKFLGKSKVKMIILDNDFPQYSPDDAQLAASIHQCDSGQLSGYKIPVLMARTVNRNTSSNLIRLEVPTSPSGVLAELKKLEPNVDVLEKYTGSTGVWLDQDQVVRSLATNIQGQQNTEYKSIAVKTVNALGEATPAHLPNPMIIDYAGPPNSELYPIRPYTYLLDPQRQEEMIHPAADSADVTLKDAIVILGDGVVDVYNTSTSNSGYNFMSGPEILANAVDTISRKSWLNRTSGLESICWIFLNALAGAGLISFWRKHISSKSESLSDVKDYKFKNLCSDLFILVVTMMLSVLSSCLLFAYVGIIVPLISPLVALVFGSVATIVWERERDRVETMRLKVQSAEDKLQMLQEIHKVELDAQAAHAQAREYLKEREQRLEFLHKINHDLRGPVGVLNWTIMRLQKEGLQSKSAPQKLERLANSSDRLGALLDELMHSYEDKPEAAPQDSDIPLTDLNSVVSDCYKLQSSLAEERDSNLTYKLLDAPAYAAIRQLEISRCVDNIIRNALLHNKQGVSVEVALSENQNAYCISIKDNGKGISAQHLDHIFEAGYRVSQNQDSHKDGQGLGLHIVKSLVEAMGGHVNVESKINLGTTFAITLPAAIKCVAAIPELEQSSESLDHTTGEPVEIYV